MDLGIKGRKALVCASSQGLGLACATSLAQEGCEVFLNGRKADKLQRVATELAQATGAKVHAVVGDITTPEGRAALLAACPEPDILINNNAGPTPGKFEDWDHDVAQIDRIAKVTKADVVRVANKYFGKDYVCGYRRDAPAKLPAVEKPEITKVDIDPRQVSVFAQQVMAMPVKPIEPTYIDPKKDYAVAEVRKGITLYHVANPINDIFTLTFSVEFGSHQDNTIGTAAQWLQKAGTPGLDSEDIKKEWYKLGTTFGIGAGDNETTITLTGLDENLAASLKLLMELLTHPVSDDETLEELKQIILADRKSVV